MVCQTLRRKERKKRMDNHKKIPCTENQQLSISLQNVKGKTKITNKSFRKLHLLNVLIQRRRRSFSRKQVKKPKNRRPIKTKNTNKYISFVTRFPKFQERVEEDLFSKATRTEGRNDRNTRIRQAEGNTGRGKKNHDLLETRSSAPSPPSVSSFARENHQLPQATSSVYREPIARIVAAIKYQTLSRHK